MKFILLFTFFIGSLVWATPRSFEESESYRVLPGSQSQELIDAAIESIFSSPLRQSLCQVFGGPVFLAIFAGVNFERAEKIMNSCRPEDLVSVYTPKAFPKQYYLIFSDTIKPDVYSWTTEENRTYLWITPDITFSQLKALLAHELAISLDAKMGLSLPMYFRYELLHVAKSDEQTIVIEIPTRLSSQEERIRKALAGGSHNPIAYALASMRAFQFETMVLHDGGMSELDHASCVRRFQSLYKLMTSRPQEFSADPNSVQGQFVKLMEKQVSPDLISESLSAIADPNFKIGAKNRWTFCQYMSTPLLSSRSSYSFFANGPRPRVGGGWNSEQFESNFNSEVKSPSTNLDLERKYQEQGVRDSQDRLLIKDFKYDLILKKIQKIEGNQSKKPNFEF